jgi:hypothetical protein
MMAIKIILSTPKTISKRDKVNKLIKPCAVKRAVSISEKFIMQICEKLWDMHPKS